MRIGDARDFVTDLFLPRRYINPKSENVNFRCRATAMKIVADICQASTVIRMALSGAVNNR